MSGRRILALVAVIGIAIAGAVAIGAEAASRRTPAQPTPAQPELLIRGAARENLTRIARRLFGLPFSTILTPPESASSATMVAGVPSSAIPGEIDSVLRQYGFTHTRILASDSVAVFVSIPRRTLYRYTYSVRPLGPPYTVPSTLTLKDFGSWRELLRIAQVGVDSSHYTRSNTVFEPTIIYPYLQQTLGESRLATFASKRGPGEITRSEMLAVLSVLNEQRLVSSRLIEHPRITYEMFDDRVPGVEPERMLVLGWRRHGRPFWTVPLLDTLLKVGAIQWAPDGRHLRIQEPLSADNERRIEWLHVGIMNFLYGNLLEIGDPGYDLDLGGGWYFKLD